jgi:hypothetical protein
MLSLGVLVIYFLWIVATHNKVTKQHSLSSNFLDNIDVVDKKEWKLNNKNRKKRKRAKPREKKESVEININNTNTTSSTEEEDNPSVLHPQLQHFYNISSDGTNVWDDPSSKLPSWMKQYLNWHKHQRKQIMQNQANSDSDSVFSSGRFLVMQCLQNDHRCGGTSDRLKPIAFALRTAYYTRRILLIHWDKPSLLEEFLVPPKGGLDWRMPEWMSVQVRTVFVGS